MSRVIKPWVVTPIKHKSLLKGSRAPYPKAAEKRKPIAVIIIIIVWQRSTIISTLTLLSTFPTHSTGSVGGSTLACLSSRENSHQSLLGAAFSSREGRCDASKSLVTFTKSQLKAIFIFLQHASFFSYVGAICRRRVVVFIFDLIKNIQRKFSAVKKLHDWYQNHSLVNCAKSHAQAKVTLVV